MPINPKEGEDDQISPKSYTRGESSPKTPDDGSRNIDQPTEMIEESEQNKSAPTRSGRVRKPTQFNQPGLDYVNYMNTREPSSYE